MLAAFAACISCSNQLPALEMKGITPNMSEADVKARVPGLLCSSLANEPGRRECMWMRLLNEPLAELRTYGDIPAKSWYFNFFDDRLGMVGVDFEAEFSDALRILSEKYGQAEKPPSRDTKIFIAIWQGRNGELVLRSVRIGTGLSLTSVTMTAPWFKARDAQNSKALATAKAKDL